MDHFHGWGRGVMPKVLEQKTGRPVGFDRGLAIAYRYNHPFCYNGYMANKTFFLQRFRDGEIHKTLQGKFAFLKNGRVKGEFESVAELSTHQDPEPEPAKETKTKRKKKRASNRAASARSES